MKCATKQSLDASSSLPQLHWTKEQAGSSSTQDSFRLVSGEEKASIELIQGDNLKALRLLAQTQANTFTFAYLDPPYLTGREFFHEPRSRSKSGKADAKKLKAFDDRWKSMGEYLDHLEPRLRAVRELLTENGSMVLHVDSKTVHYAKVLCDQIFGIESFASEVIWRYRRWPSKTPNFQRVHDVMIRYVKNSETRPRFHQLYEPLAPSTQATWGTKKQRAVTNDDGKRLRSSTGNENSLGTPLGDVWDISIVAPVAKERTGYPTQKPEALLKRWLEACTAAGDKVLDPYMGSGTTLKVAAELDRKAVGIDAGPAALNVAMERLHDAKIDHRHYCIDSGKKAEQQHKQQAAQPLSMGAAG
ncbi:MAG: site-specific DNA-methyltransferase [Polyangiaceae bacterium]|nr:site-specific DNA-methyltransferase [Polyangiaceae bacterium]